MEFRTTPPPPPRGCVVPSTEFSTAPTFFKTWSFMIWGPLRRDLKISENGQCSGLSVCKDAIPREFGFTYLKVPSHNDAVSSLAWQLRS